MKKLLFMFVAALATASVSAQTVTESKTFDNFILESMAGLRPKLPVMHGLRI